MQPGGWGGDRSFFGSKDSLISFTIDGLGGWFVERIDGDPSNVIGLSLPLTRTLLEQTGLAISVLWQANPLTA